MTTSHETKTKNVLEVITLVLEYLNQKPKILPFLLSPPPFCEFFLTDSLISAFLFINFCHLFGLKS